MSWTILNQTTRDLFHSRAGNYDCTGQDLYNQLIEQMPEIAGHDLAITDVLKGNPELGIPQHEVMHEISDANNGTETIDNLRWGPEDINGEMLANNMTPADMEMIAEANDMTVEILVDHYDIATNVGEAVVSGTELADTAMETPEVIETFDFIQGAGSTMPVTTDVVTTATEVGGETILESAGELIVDGLMPAIVGGKVAYEVIQRCETTQDKIGWGSLSGGAAVAAACTPLGQAAIAGYCGYKLLKFGFKVYKKAVA